MCTKLFAKIIQKMCFSSLEGTKILQNAEKFVANSGIVVPLRAKNRIMHSLRFGKRLVELTSPQVMGIVNITPDSFSVHCSSCSEAEVLASVSNMLQAGADIIDVGGYSTRPGAAFVSEEEEWHRVSGIAGYSFNVERCNHFFGYVPQLHSAKGDRAVRCADY